MKGIPPSLNEALRNVLVDCSPLEDVHLRALFVSDERLALWERHLPSLEGLNHLTRIEALIGYLINQANQANENGLVLFLRVLRDETDTREACYERLDRLADQVVVVLREQSETGSHTEKTRLDEKNLLLADVQVTLRQDKKGWFLQAQNISQRPLKKVTFFLHPGPALWVNKHKLSLGTLLPTDVSTSGPIIISIKQPQGSIEREAYQLGIEVVYLPQPGNQPLRLQKLLEIFMR